MALLRTPLHDRHVAAGGQMVEFAGWEMPLQYTSMREEHTAVRERVGLFDVSHMGELELRGEGATAALDRAVTNAIGDLEVGQARYTCICAEDGGIVDDALVYREEWGWMVVVNAGTRTGDVEHLRGVLGGACEMRDGSLETALIAVQGPHAVATVQPLASVDLAPVPYYHFVHGAFGDIPCRFSRTGYTGEDGLELFVPWDRAGEVWDRLMEAGADQGVAPCGLGARDTLRLEAAMRLYGMDITRETNPLEAGLGWVVKLDKGDFVGAEALRRVRAEGPRRTMIGLELEGRAIARHGHPILDGGRPAGEVTSGTFSFSLGRAVAIGYVETASRDSPDLAVEVRGEPVPARRVPLPFYKRQR
jgi:aminomethyltransferase